MLARLKIEKVDERAAETRARSLGYLIRPLDEKPACVREEHKLIMRLGNENEAEEILLLDLRAFHAVTAAALLAIFRKRHAFYVAAVGKRNDARLVGNKVFKRNFVDIIDDFRATARIFLRAVFKLDFRKIGADDCINLLRVGKDALKLGDRREKLRQLLHKFIALKADELVKAHFKNRIHLRGGKAETLLQGTLRLFAGVRGAYHPHHFIEVVDRENKAINHMLARLGLAQIETRAPRNHFKPVIDVASAIIFERKHFRAAADDGEENRAERRLKLRMLVEAV